MCFLPSLLHHIEESRRSTGFNDRMDFVDIFARIDDGVN